MYLHAKRFCSGGYDHSTKEEKKLFKTILKAAELPQEMAQQSLTVNVTVGYWRKANHIHKWFIDNCSSGEDDCRPVDVCRDSLKTLRDLCQTVIDKSNLVPGNVHVGTSFEAGEKKEMYEPGKIVEDPTVALDILPPSEGFFFGGQDVDEYYIEDVKETIKIIDAVLKLPKDWEFEYCASW